MKLAGPMYEGDSILRAAHEAVESTVNAPETATSSSKLMQRNTAIRNTAAVVQESWAIEQRARRLRSEWIWSQAKAVFEGLARWFERREAKDREAYLAQAQNHVDLEHRMRRLERSGKLLRI